MLAGSTIRALEDYNLSTTRLITRRGLQLQEMVGMLTDTVAAISSDGGRSTAGLNAIEGRLKKAATIEDIGRLQFSLEECLEAVRHEAVRQREETAKLITSLNKTLEESEITPSESRPAPEAGKLDPLTGLPERAAAENELRAALQARRHTFVVPFVLPQLPTLNSRFGYKVIDQILVFVCQHISVGLPSDASLYRWSGASFLAIFECSESVDQVKRRLARDLAPVRLRKILNVDGREILIMVEISCKVLPVFEFSTEKDLIRGVDWFIKAELKS